MIKLKNPDGTFRLGQRVNPENLGEVLALGNKREEVRRSYTWTIEGLPEKATEQEGINQLIQDLFLQGKIDPVEVTDGTNSFKKLYTIITQLGIDKANLINELEKLKS